MDIGSEFFLLGTIENIPCIKIQGNYLINIIEKEHIAYITSQCIIVTNMQQ